MGQLVDAIMGDILQFSFPAIGLPIYEGIALGAPNKYLEALVEAPPDLSPAPPADQINIELHTIPWLLKGFKPGEPGSNEFGKGLEKRLKQEEKRVEIGKEPRGKAGPEQLLPEHRRLIARMNLALQMTKEEDLQEDGDEIHFRYFTPEEAKILLEAPEEHQLGIWASGLPRPDRDHLTLVVKDTLEDKEKKQISPGFSPINLLITQEFLEQINQIRKEPAMAGKKVSPIEEMITKVSNGPAPYFIIGKDVATKFSVKDFLKLKAKIEAMRKLPDSPATDLTNFYKIWCIDEVFFKTALIDFSGDQIYNHLNKLTTGKSRNSTTNIDNNQFMAEIIARSVPCVYKDSTIIDALAPGYLDSMSIPYEINAGEIILQPDGMVALIDGLDYETDKVIAILLQLLKKNEDKYIRINGKAKQKKAEAGKKGQEA